jgi:hypothetical protein
MHKLSSCLPTVFVNYIFVTMDKTQKLGGSKHRLVCGNCVPFMLKGGKKTLLSDEYSFAFLNHEELRLYLSLSHWCDR